MLLNNLLSVYKRADLPEELHTARPKRLRLLVPNTIGKLVRHARETVLRLGAEAGRALPDRCRTAFGRLAPRGASARPRSLSHPHRPITNNEDHSQSPRADHAIRADRAWARSAAASWPDYHSDNGSPRPRIAKGSRTNKCAHRARCQRCGPAKSAYLAPHIFLWVP